MSMTALTPDTDSLPALLEWLPVFNSWLLQTEGAAWRHQLIEGMLDDVVHRLASDTSLRVPRKPEERANGFAVWLSTAWNKGVGLWWRGKKRSFVSRLQRELPRRFPEMFSHPPGSRYTRYIIDLLWIDTEIIARHRVTEYLLHYAIRGIALNFVGRRLGDNWMLGIPQQRGNNWSVPLFADKLQTEPSAEIILDRDGNILSDDNSLRRQLGIVVPGLGE